MGLVVSHEELVQKLSQIANKKTVFTNGCFDIVHLGHVDYLKKAKQLADILIIGVNSDNSVRRLKGELRPVQNEITRSEILSSFYFVDYVCVFDEDTPFNLIKKIQPDFLVKGGDWSPDQIIGSDIVIGNGGQVKSIQFLEGYSTSSVIDKILKTHKLH